MSADVPEIRLLTIKVGDRYIHSPGSNYFPSPIPAPRGRIAPTIEHYLHAAKSLDHEVQDRILAAPTPGEAKRIGREIELRPGWDERRLGVMRRALGYKFATGTRFAKWLSWTDPFRIVEGNHWNDKFWGQVLDESGNWVGENWLGVLLMARRAEVRAANNSRTTKTRTFEDMIEHAVTLKLLDTNPLPARTPDDVPERPTGPATCSNWECDYPAGACRIETEFAGCHDADDFYDPGDSVTCVAINANEPEATDA